MEGKEADTIVILSSELISKITEEYFNKTMFKQKVTIVDLKPTESGYMFSVSFIPPVRAVKGKSEVLNGYSGRVLTPAERQEAVRIEMEEGTDRLVKATLNRASNGKFAKVKEGVQ